MLSSTNSRTLLIAALTSTVLAGNPLSADVGACHSHPNTDLLHDSDCGHSFDARNFPNDSYADGQPRLPPLVQAELDRLVDFDTSEKLDPIYNITKGECMTGSNEEEFCAYTVHEFGKDRGIYLLGSQDMVDRFPHLPAFTRPEALDDANNFDNPPYERRPIPGKGRGVVATRIIHPGELIFKTTPLILADSSIYDFFGPDERAELVDKLIEAIPPKRRAGFLELSSHNSDRAMHEGILATNSFNAQIVRDPSDEGRSASALFVEPSYMNHDCRPNLHYHFNSATLTQSIHAVRTIYPGEELTISYIQLLMPYNIRHQRLHDNWGFDCSCRACTEVPRVRIISDARIRAIDQLREELYDLGPDSRGTPDMAELFVSLLELERESVLVCEAYSSAAREHNGVGHAHQALKYANLALAAGLQIEDVCGDHMLDMLDLVQEGPRMHWSWKFRLNMGKSGGSKGNETTPASEMVDEVMGLGQCKPFA